MNARLCRDELADALTHLHDVRTSLRAVAAYLPLKDRADVRVAQQEAGLAEAIVSRVVARLAGEPS